MQSTALAGPPYDAELAAALQKIPIPHTLTRSHIQPMRGGAKADPNTINENFEHVERTIPAAAGDIILSIFRKRERLAKPGPGVYHIHGGGMIIGNRFAGVPEILGYLQDFNAVCVSVEYRLAPEHQYPVPLEDCYVGLTWMSENAAEIGQDPTQIITAGSSAGGGLAAGVSMLARDRLGPKLCAQMLLSPMLDDRNQTVSSQQYVGEGTRSRESNIMAWECLLGDKRGSEQFSHYAAPSRASDLTTLPMAYIDVGAAEVFRDEDVAYGSRLWECGIQAELHVWPGGFHAFDLLAPKAVISVAARKARGDWMRRVLSKMDHSSILTA